MILDQNYINTKKQVIKAERQVLKELGFCVHVKHPHKVSKNYSYLLKLRSLAIAAVVSSARFFLTGSSFDRLFWLLKTD